MFTEMDPLNQMIGIFKIVIAKSKIFLCIVSLQDFVYYEYFINEDSFHKELGVPVICCCTTTQNLVT